MSDLTPIETARLENAEIVIADGLSGFIKVGKALAEIQEGRLYRETHATFDEYLKAKWNLSRSRGYQLIEAAEVAEAVSTNGGQIDNERQARELAKVDPEDRMEVLDMASVNGATSASKIRNAAAEIKEAKAPSDIPSVPESRGVGVRWGNAAIDALKRIPQNDGLRARGFQLVLDWIKRNK